MITFPTRLDNILDLILTSAPEKIVNIACAPAKLLDISTDHNLIFFDLVLRAKSSTCEKRTVFNFNHADWNGLCDALNHTDLSFDESGEDIDADWSQWKTVFLELARDCIPVKVTKRHDSPP